MADDRMDLMVSLDRMALVAREVFEAFRRVGFDSDHSLQLTMQVIDRSDWHDDVD